MKLLYRILLLMIATLVLIFAVVIGSAFVLLSAIRWLFTGKKADRGLLCTSLSTLETYGEK